MSATLPRAVIWSHLIDRTIYFFSKLKFYEFYLWLTKPYKGFPNKGDMF